MYARRLRQASLAITLTAGVLLSVAPGAAAQPGEPLQPCVNFRHEEEAGAVEIDERWDPKTGGFTTLTIFWFINEPGAAPGTYYWNHIVNGVPTSGPHLDIKDDNLHTAFAMRDGWRYGDRYTFKAVHFSPATNTSYVAAVNECLIVPRT